MPWTPIVGAKNSAFQKEWKWGLAWFMFQQPVPPVCTALSPAPWHGFPSCPAGKGALNTTKTQC